MFVYLFLLFLALVNLIFVKSPKIKIPSLIIVVFMFLLCGFRAETIGTDTGSYVDIVNGTKANAEEKMEFQLLLRLLVEIARVTSLPFFFSLCAILTYFPLFIILNKSCGRFLPIALLVFIVSMQAYFIQSLNIMRQVMATVFLLCSYYEINKGNKILFVLWYILALLIHTISLIILPFLFISSYKFSFRTVLFIILSAICFAFYFASGFGIETLLSHFSDIEYMNLYHFAYYENETEHYGVFGLIKLLIPCSLFCLCSYKLLKGHFYCRLYMWGVVILCLSAPWTIYALRLSMGLYATELFIIPMLYKKLSNRQLLIPNVYVLFLIIYYLYTSFNLYMDDKLLVPYRFFFE